MPVIVNVYVPRGVAGAVRRVVTRMVVVPDVTDVGLNVAVALAGNPLTLKLTSPVKPPEGVTVTV